MDPSTRVVSTFLESMRSVREALDDLLRRLYKRPEVKLVHTYRPEATPSPDFGLSADLHNGAVVDFWLELQWDGTSWELEYFVARHDPDEDGSHDEILFPTKSIRSVLELPSALVTAIKALEDASATETLFR